MTPDLAVSLLLATVVQLGPFRGVKCTPAQIQQMSLVMRADPDMPTAGVLHLVQHTCKKVK